MSVPNVLKLVVLIIAVYATADYTRLDFLYHLSYALAAILVISFLWTRVGGRSIEITRRVEANHAQAGENIRDYLSAANDSLWPKPFTEVEDHSDLPGHNASAVFALRGKKSKRWRVETTCRRRGRYTLGPMTVSTGDPFGLFRLRRHLSWTSEILVYPPILELPGFALPAGELPGGELTEHDTQHVTPNAAGVREYAPGDSFNRISWSATARFQHLMVKEFELDPLSDTWILLDMDFGAHSAVGDGTVSGVSSLHQVELENSSEEYAVTIAASLASTLLGRNYPVGLISWAQHHEVLPPDRGRRQLNKMLETLAIIRAEGNVSLAEVLAAETMRFSRNSSIVVITGSTDEQWLFALQHCLLRGARATAIVIDLASFGGRGSSLTSVAALESMQVRAYLVRKGDPIDKVFGRVEAGQRV